MAAWRGPERDPRRRKRGARRRPREKCSEAVRSRLRLALYDVQERCLRLGCPGGLEHGEEPRRGGLAQLPDLRRLAGRGAHRAVTLLPFDKQRRDAPAVGREGRCGEPSARRGAGLLYLLSLRLLAAPAWSVPVLVLGRAVLGAAESCVVTGTLTWCLSLAGPRDAGKVMSWVGLAMYVALAVGAPAGTALYGAVGFGGIALATTSIPLAGLALVARVRPVAPRATARPAFVRIVGAVWKPGLGLALSSIGFGAVTTFIVLLFAQRGWEHAWLGLTLFFGAFVVGRLRGSHLPDRLGGARVALVSVVVEAAGQAVIWLAPSARAALFGAALSGFGYTLVYPGYGVEAVRRAPPESRGLAMGAYTAFLDLALGVASPVLGLVASGAGRGRRSLRARGQCEGRRLRGRERALR